MSHPLHAWAGDSMGFPTNFGLGKWSRIHNRHDVAPSSDEVGVAHEAQDTAPWTSAYLARSQGMHVVAALVSEKLPTEQFRHSD